LSSRQQQQQHLTEPIEQAAREGAVQATMATRGLMRLCCFLSGVLLLSFVIPSALAEERFYEFVVRVRAP
jgi:hypothetical protein